MSTKQLEFLILPPFFLFGLAAETPAPAEAPEPLGADWVVRGDGEWVWIREYQRLVKQPIPTGTHSALCPTISGREGAWRCWVEPALGTAGAGMWFQASPDLSRGFLCVLGGNPPLGGLRLQNAVGETLWEDKWAPWKPYQPYVLEGVVEPGRVRVQMLEWDAQTLVSQSDWIEVPAEATEPEGCLGLYTTEGIARFWNWARAETPLSPITEEAPNKRRLVQSEGSEWVIVGPGNWMWTDRQKQRIRQYAPVERSSAINRSRRGAWQTWRCRVQVSPGAGGAGMLFQTDEEAQTGFLCWLGGNWGAGGLMLYRLPTDCLWSSGQDFWRYDTEYVLQATTRQGGVRVQMFAADGQTLLVESPWIEIPEEEAAREGYVGFMTWKGMAEFAEFSEDTRLAVEPEPESPAAEGSEGLGPGWKAFGEGRWEWAGEERTTIRQTAAVEKATVLAPSPAGILGVWRGRVKISEGTDAAGLLFQADPGLKEGFLCLLTGPPETGSLKLQNLAGRTLWAGPQVVWQTGTEYVLEGHVEIDRVRVRLLAADGQAVLAESPAIYVSDTNNHRTGVLGFTTHGGPAEFGGWGLE